jgi:hypothetical protein
MPTEIIMVVQDQDFRLWPRLLPEEISRREAADSSSYNDQVVALVGVFDIPKNALLTIANLVGNFE